MADPNDAQTRTFRCTSCNSQLAFDATSGMLRCAHCGHQQAVPASGGRVVERDLFEGLSARARGLGAQVRTSRCGECGASVSFGGGKVATRCAFCGSPQVLEQHENQNALRPESLLPFSIDKKTANAHFARWLKKLWFRPRDLSRIARVHEVNGVYVPFWTYDADVHSHWRADRGRYYYVDEEYTIQEQGQMVRRTRQRRETSWQPAWGQRRDRYDDLLICASRGLPSGLAEHLKTFDTRRLVVYSPGYLAGWSAEEYAVDLGEGWQIAERHIEGVQRGRCASDVGGDTHRSLSVDTTCSRVMWKHVLLPVWIAAYRYRDKVYRFLVNGQTGEVVGKAPWSVGKILLFILFLAAIVTAIVLLAQAQD